MFGRTIQHRGEEQRGERDGRRGGADCDIQRRKMRKESGTRNARIERVT